MTERLPDLTFLVENSSDAMTHHTNAILLISTDSNRFKSVCAEMAVDRYLNSITEGN